MNKWELRGWIFVVLSCLGMMHATTESQWGVSLLWGGIAGLSFGLFFSDIFAAWYERTHNREEQ